MDKNTSNEQQSLGTAIGISDYQKIANAVIGKFINNKKLKKDEIPTALSQINAAIENKKTNFSGKPASIARLMLQDICSGVCNNIEDMRLLNSNSPGLIEKYRYQTLSIIKKYHSSHKIEHDQITYLAEDINGKLVEKLLNNSLHQYRGGVLFRTYFYRITENALKDELRKKSVRIKTHELNTAVHEKPDEPNGTVNWQHLDSLANMLQLLFTKWQRRKFEFCIKVVYRLILIKKDILQDYPLCSAPLQKKILRLFGIAYHHMPKGELWESLNDVIGRLEEKQQSVRTLKDWIQAMKIKILEAILKCHINPKTLAQKSAIDHYMELLIHQYYNKR